MRPERLHRFFVAPEIIVVDLLLASLETLRLALLTEHPQLDDELAAHDDPPVRRAARKSLYQAARLRRALRLYRKTVDTILTEPDLPTDPF